MFTFCRKESDLQNLVRLIKKLDNLTLLQQEILRIRYINLLLEYETRCRTYDIFFHLMRFFVTAGSLTVPALLSIQFPDHVSTSLNTIALYWITWAFSLMVTLSNGVITLFRIDKKYFILHTTKEQLVSEGWQYFQLSGRYSGFFGQHRPSHANQFVYFCNIIEKIKMKQVEDEYYKIFDNDKEPKKGDDNSEHNQKRTNLIPPTPANGEMYPVTPETPMNTRPQLPSPINEKDSIIIFPSAEMPVVQKIHMTNRDGVDRPSQTDDDKKE